LLDEQVPHIATLVQIAVVVNIVVMVDLVACVQVVTEIIHKIIQPHQIVENIHHLLEEDRQGKTRKIVFILPLQPIITYQQVL
jgi:hypothetical protein